MEMQNTLKLITVLLLLEAARAVTFSSSSPSFSPVVVQAKYEHTYNKIINATVEYVFLYPASNVTLETARIKIESNATHSSPLIIVIRQTTGILSWQIPLLINSADLDTMIYNKTSRTLCSTKYYRYAQNDDEYVIVGISTASRGNITFYISVVEVTDFYLSSGNKIEVQISPSEPIYYGYIFSKQENSSVIVRVESDNDVCMTISVQNTSCPVFDLERNIEFSGHWQTVSRRGGITVPREAYPLGFFVVLVVKGEDIDCNGLSSSNPLRTKNITLIVNPTITKRDYVVASASAAAIILGFCITYITAVIVFNIRESKKLATQDPINEQNQDFNEHIPSPSVVGEVINNNEFIFHVQNKAHKV